MKNRLHFVILSILIAISSFVYGQDESLFNRINGVKLKENIFIKWDESKKTFVYASDGIDSWHTIDDDLIFNIRNDHKNNFKTYIQFYNPLRYSIKSEVKDIDDPAYQAINEFISQLPTLPNIPTSEANKSLLPAASVTTSKGVVELKQLTILHEWAYQFSQAIDSTIVNSDATSKNEFGDLLNSINELEKADKYLYGKIFIENIPEYTSKTFSLNQWIKERSDILYEANNNYDDFKTKLNTSNDVLKGLQKSKDEADKSLKDVIDILSSKFDQKIAKFIIASKKNDFKKYSNSTSVWLSMNHIDRFDANKKAIEKFEAYLKKLKEHTDKFAKKECDKSNVCFQFYEDSDFKLDWKSQKMKSFSYEYKKLESDGGEVAQSNAKSEFTVSKRLGLYPFVSTGILGTGFWYPNYTISTDNGINTVGEAPDSKVYMRPAVFLNFLVTGKLNPVYPFFQLGITTGIKDAIFPVGAGFTIGKSFSFSGGAMIGYRKDLKTLKVGDIVKDETELENNLIYKGFVSWYVSINYNIGKK